MPYDTRLTLEPADPIAHPHYPNRPARAIAVTHSVVTEPVDDQSDDQSWLEEPRRS